MRNELVKATKVAERSQLQLATTAAYALRCLVVKAQQLREAVNTMNEDAFDTYVDESSEVLDDVSDAQNALMHVSEVFATIEARLSEQKHRRSFKAAYDSSSSDSDDDDLLDSYITAESSSLREYL